MHEIFTQQEMLKNCSVACRLFLTDGTKVSDVVYPLSNLRRDIDYWHYLNLHLQSP